MKPHKSKAIILRRTNYGEADRILSLLTPESGKISAIAKGVRKSKSKLAGGLELLAICEVTFIEGSGHMARITSARLDNFFGNILTDYDRLNLAYLCLKKIAKATENAQSPDFFNLILQTLHALNDSKVDIKLIEICFNLQLSAQFGASLNLLTDRDGNKLDAAQKYSFDSQENIFYPNGSGGFTDAHIKLLRLATVKSPLVLAKISGLQNILNDCLLLAKSVEFQ